MVVPARDADSVPDTLARADRLVEVGIGTNFSVALALTERGCTVTATDIVDRSVPDPVEFRRDDITDPNLDLYRDAELVYAIRCPPELQAALATVGAIVDATVCFTTLGTDPPVVPVDVISLPDWPLYHVDQSQFTLPTGGSIPFTDSH